MKSFGFEREYNYGISQHVIDGFRATANMLSEFGDLTVAGNSPTFHEITAHNDVLEVKDKSLNDRPSFICTGDIVLPERENSSDKFGKTKIYLPVEGGKQPDIEVHGEEIQPSLLYRSITPAFISEHGKTSRLIDDTLLAVDNRVFRVFSVEPYVYPIYALSYGYDYETSLVIDSMKILIDKLNRASKSGY